MKRLPHEDVTVPKCFLSSGNEYLKEYSVRIEHQHLKRQHDWIKGLVVGTEAYVNLMVKSISSTHPCLLLLSTVPCIFMRRISRYVHTESTETRSLVMHLMYYASYSGCEDTCTSSQYTRSELVCYWSSEWHYQTDDVAVVHACEARVGNKAVCRSTARQHMLALCFRDCLSSVHIVRPFLSHTQGKKERQTKREKPPFSLSIWSRSSWYADGYGKPETLKNNVSLH